MSNSPRRRKIQAHSQSNALKDSIASLSKHKVIRATVIEALGNTVTVRLNTNGRVLHGIELVGGPAPASSTVLVSYVDGHPIANATGEEATTVTLPEYKEPAITDQGLYYQNPYSFLDLNDTPFSYTGSEKYTVRVNESGSALEFVKFAEGNRAIVLYDVSEDMVEEYDPDDDGFDDALADADAGDVITIPATTLAANHTLVADVAIVGLSRQHTKLTGQITCADGSSLQNLTIERLVNTSSTLKGIVVPASCSVTLLQLQVIIENTGTGDVRCISAEGNGSYVQTRNSYYSPTAASGSPYGFWVDTGTNASIGARFCLVTGTIPLNTNNNITTYACQFDQYYDIMGTAGMGDRAPYHHTHTSGSDGGAIIFLGYCIVRFDVSEGTFETYENTSAGVTDALADAATGDLVVLPPGIFTGSYTVPANVGLIGYSQDSTTLTGVITLSNGSEIRGLSIVRNASDSSTLIGLYAPATGAAEAADIDIEVTQAGSGDAYSIYVPSGDGDLSVARAYLKGWSGGGSGYGVCFHASATGLTRIWHAHIYTTTDPTNDTTGRFETYGCSMDMGGNHGDTIEGDLAAHDHTHPFIDLSDVPSSYSGQAGKAVKVNSGEDGLEFVTSGSDGATTFLELLDSPSSYSGQALKGVRVNSGEDGVEFSDLLSGSDIPFTELSDTPSSYSGQGAKAVRVNTGETGLALSAFLELDDTPSSYSGQGGKFVKVNSTPDALEFADASLDDLDDVNAPSPNTDDVLMWTGSQWTSGSLISASGSGHTIQDEGTPLTQRTNLNFAGSTVTVTDDAGNDATLVTITGTSGSDLDLDFGYYEPVTNGDATDPGLIYNGGDVVMTLVEELPLAMGSVIPTAPGGRLTLTSGTPVTTSDVSAATTLYYTPYMGNKIELYYAGEWTEYLFNELSLSLSGYTADKNYDIFIYNNSGTLTLESVAWTNDTTRATALTTQDGVYVKSGDSTRRYLGTIRTISTTGQVNDGAIKRFVWNYYNRVDRRLLYGYTGTNHTYTGTSWRYWNNDSDSRIYFVVGVREDAPLVFYGGEVKSSSDGTYARLGVGFDTDTDNIVQLANLGNANVQNIYGIIGGTLSLQYQMTEPGYHFFSGLEKVDGGTGTFGQLRLHAKIRA